MVAPSSGIAAAKLNALEQQLAAFNVVIPKPLLTDECLFHSSSDNQRFDQLVVALYDSTPNSIIWALRGGYGCARLLERLRMLAPPPQPKLFIGFSDNTALHLFLAQQWQWRTVHAAGLAQLVDTEPRDPANFTRLAELLSGERSQQTLTELRPMNGSAARLCSVSGVMQGGNLTIVESSIGTFWQAKTAGSILFLEDTGEKGYRIDRSLQHLQQAGLLRDVQAVLLGDFLGPDTSGIAYALQRFANENVIPVFQTDQFGHGERNYPILYGANGRLDLYDAASATLTMEWL